MSQKHPHLNRNHPLSSRRQSSSYMYPLAQNVPVVPQQVPMGQNVPMTPLDFSYSQSMLPANLLSTPSPYVGSSVFPHYAPNGSYLPSSASSPSLVAGPQFYAPGQGYPFPVLHRGASTSSLDHQGVSRTVVLENLAPDLTLRAVLDAIDFGPIESCELVAQEKTKSCYISFTNTQTSVNFVHKYSMRPKAKSLQKALADSDLTVAFADSAPSRSKGKARAPADYIKAKTLTYILEHNATRAVSLCFKILDSDLVFLMPKAVRRRCAKFGEVEDFDCATDEDKCEMTFVVHFTNIDSAIKVFDYHKKRLPNGSVKDEMVDDSVQLLCLGVEFQPDRCDRSSQKPEESVESNSASSRSASLLASIPSSPVTSREKSVRGRSESLGNPPSPRKVSPKSKVLNNERISSSERASPLLHTSFDDEKSFACGTELEVSPEAQSVLDDSDSPSQVSDFSHLPQPFAPTFHPSASDSFCYLPSVPYNMGVPSHTRKSFVGTPSYPQYTVEQINACNRTLYLGNLHPKTTAEEICNNVRAGGLVESIKYYQAKRTCFITFIDPAIALKFYLNHQVMHQLIIRDTEVQVKWGSNHSGPLRRDIAYSVAAGASRNVYIGLKVNKSKGDAVQLPDEATLREDFSKFGKMEQINFVKDKDCGFMNFMNILNAIKVVECFEQRDVELTKSIVGDNGEFYEKYSKFKISYGKDRCGNPLRFSFKKRPSYHSSREKSFSERGDSVTMVSEVEPIDEESANVFGITTTSTAKNADTASKTPVAESTFSKESVGEVESDSDGDYFYDTENAPEEKDGDEKEDKDVGANKKTVLEEADAFNISVSTEAEKQEENEFEEEDDDDDDISIIIGSDSTRTSRQNPRKARRKPQKVYHHSLDLNELLGGQWRPDQNYGNGYAQAPMPMHPMYYTPGMRLSADNVSGWYDNGAGYGYGNPVMYNSGSQVMADYLAKSQPEGYFYGYGDSTENFRGPQKRRSK